MERRVLLAIFLAFLVLYVWQALFVKPVPKPASAPPASTPATTAPARTDIPQTEPAPAVIPATPAASRATPLVAAISERDVQVETRDAIATFTNRGGRLKGWKLKHYFDQRHQPQELVESQLGDQLPFTLRTTSDTTNLVLNDALYTVTGTNGSAQNSPTDLRFEYRDSVGLSVIKEFHLDPTSYIITFRASITEGTRTLAPTIVWGPAVGDTAEVSRYSQAAQGLIGEIDKVQRLAPKDIAKQAVYQGDFRYAGVDDNYFMTAALFPGACKITYQPVSIPPPAESKDAPRTLVSYSVELSDIGTPVKFFVGPKDFDVLAAIGPEMPRAINFGMFAVIVVPLLRSLKWVNGYVGNYGWSIVILTVIINVIMFPLQHKSIVSMRRMQEIQPETKAIQDRYAKLKATDPQKQKMNQELMALYREKGVNPAGGCVPVLLTMPVFLAMWAMLAVAIELRGAPFFGWIRDLTAHDPYFVTPILMGVTQVWQMKMTPTTGMDQTQRNMQMVMPVVMMVMFLWMPAGAILYYLVSNLWRIGQQSLTNYLIGPPNVRTIRPAAERRTKRVGGGKTEAASRES